MNRRTFVALTAAAGAMAAGSAWADAAGLSATVERLGADKLRLSWTGAVGPARVLASSDPDAPAALMRVLTDRAPRGGLEANVSARPRPYFLIQAKSGEVRTAERLLPLEGGRNFRDLGGYRGAGGRQVRWGRIYRSGVTADLTANDLTYLGALGIATVCDFRSSAERQREPSAFASSQGFELIAADYELDYSSMGGILSASTREEAIAGFAASYAGFAETLAPQFADLFQRLLRRETPLAFNCSAGKDRTGLAAALVLSALGVERSAVIADYALSERYVPVETYLSALRGEGEASASIGAGERQLFARLPDPVARVLLGTPAEVMEQTLAKLDADYGGPLGFIAKRLAVRPAQVETLRELYLA